MQALEDTEQALGKAHVEARTVVADAVGGTAASLARFEADQRLWHLGAVLPGIAQQVFQRHAQQRGVALGHHVGRDGDRHVAFGRAAAQVVDDPAGHLRQVHRLARQRLSGQPRQRQQRVDHLVHARGCGHHPVEVVAADPVERSAVVFLEDAAEALDDADRRPQVVRHGVAESRMLGRQRAAGVVGTGVQRRQGQQQLAAGRTVQPIQPRSPAAGLGHLAGLQPQHGLAQVVGQAGQRLWPGLAAVG